MPDVWSLIEWLGEALEELRPDIAPTTAATGPRARRGRAKMPADG
jgi:hypothetical protein